MSIKENTADTVEDTEKMEVESSSEDEEMTEEPEVGASIDKVEIVGSHADPTAMTFCFKNEDHTLGNSLRHVINKNRNVDFCGYSIPHPSEAKMNVRIQTTDRTTSVEALKTGLQNLLDMVSSVRDSYAMDLEKKEYEEFEEIA
ncbi:DNA-directed RNA polymerase [Sporodiniella umbellata]|nr:DNA-directed RNA polymerase [Sporodiniella umbellata]KAI9252616.1 DNA-directed RNA polymerase [Sporodiniella umbellata]